MRRLLILQPLIRHTVLLLVWALFSCALFGQETPPPAAPPATMEPPVVDETVASSVVASSVAAIPIKPPEKPIYTSSTERDNTLLAKALPEETLWLETSNERIVALFKDSETRTTRGALLMLHAPESPQLWPASFENIRRNIPVYGWQTLALALPQKYAATPPKRELIAKSVTVASSVAAVAPADTTVNPEAAAEPKTETAPVNTTEKEAEVKPDAGNVNEEPAASDEATPTANPVPVDAITQTEAVPTEVVAPILPREQLIAERVDAAMAALNKDGKEVVVVMVDNSSAYDSLTQLYKNTNLNTSAQEVANGALHGVILVNLQDQEPLNKEQLGAIFSAEYLPIMDVFFGPDDNAQKAVRRLHRAEAMRQNVRRYQQVVVPPEQYVTIDDKQSFWLEKTRGFIERYVAEKK